MIRLALVGVLLLGCSDNTGPKLHAIPIGTYDYSFHTTRGQNQTYDYRGTFTITSATEVDVRGTWNVPEFEPQIRMGLWTDGAYNVWAGLDDDGLTGQIRNRIARKGNRITCEVIWWFIFDPVGEDVGPGTCTVTGPI